MKKIKIYRDIFTETNWVSAKTAAEQFREIINSEFSTLSSPHIKLSFRTDRKYRLRLLDDMPYWCIDKKDINDFQGVPETVFERLPEVNSLEELTNAKWGEIIYPNDQKVRINWAGLKGLPYYEDGKLKIIEDFKFEILGPLSFYEEGLSCVKVLNSIGINVPESEVDNIYFDTGIYVIAPTKQLHYTNWELTRILSVKNEKIEKSYADFFILECLNLIRTPEEERTQLVTDTVIEFYEQKILEELKKNRRLNFV